MLSTSSKLSKNTELSYIEDLNAILTGIKVTHSGYIEKGHDEVAQRAINTLLEKIMPLSGNYHAALATKVFTDIFGEIKKDGLLWKQLRCTQKRRRNRYKAYDSYGRLADKRNISDRPTEVENRKTQGHWGN